MVHGSHGKSFSRSMFLMMEVWGWWPWCGHGSHYSHGGGAGMVAKVWAWLPWCGHGSHGSHGALARSR